MKTVADNRYFLLLVLAYLFSGFILINSFPQVWIDTSWTCMTPYHMLTEGRFANPILHSPAHLPEDGLHEHHLSPEILQRVLLFFDYKFFGFGLFQSRALSVLAGLCILIVTYLFAKRYYGMKVALLAGVILITDNIFFYTSREVRGDIFVSALAMGAFFAFLHAIRSNSNKYFKVSGLLFGLSLFTHPHSILILFSVLILFIAEYRFKFLSNKNFWLFSLFVIVGFLPYVVWIISEDYSNNFAHFLAQSVGTQQQYGDLKLRLTSEWMRYSSYIFFPRRIIIFLVQLCALMMALFSKNKTSRYLAVMIWTVILLLPFLTGHRTPRHLIIFIPALSVIVADSFFFFLKDLFSSDALSLRNLLARKRLALLTILLLFVGNQLAGNLYVLWTHRDYNYNKLIAEIRDAIPSGAKVWGSGSFWIGLHDHPYMNHHIASMCQVCGEIATLHKFKPDYAILKDSFLWGGRSVTGLRKDDSNTDADSPLRLTIEKICAERGQLIKTIPHGLYGDLEIYKLNWD